MKVSHSTKSRYRSNFLKLFRNCRVKRRVLFTENNLKFYHFRNEDSFLEVKGSISDLVNYIRSTATFQNYENTYGEGAAGKILHKLEDE